MDLNESKSTEQNRPIRLYTKGRKVIPLGNVETKCLCWRKLIWGGSVELVGGEEGGVWSVNPCKKGNVMKRELDSMRD